MLGELADQPADRGFCADVDALGRLVQHDQLELATEHLGHDHLLLVPTGERTGRGKDRRRLDPQPSRQRGGQIALGGGTEPAAARQPFERRERDVAVDPPRQYQPLRLAVFRQVTDARGQRLARTSRRDRGAVQPDRSAIRGAHPVDRRAHLAASRPDQAGQRDDLAGVHAEGDIAVISDARQALDAEYLRADPYRPFRVEPTDIAADHRHDQTVGVERALLPGADVAPVAEHGDAVGQTPDILHAVRDEDHRDTRRAQVIGNPVELLALVLGQRRGRLVHDHDPRVGRQRLGDLHDLPPRDRQRAHRFARIEARAERVEQPPCVAVHPRPIDAPERSTHRFVPDEDVLGHRQVGIRRYVLIDRRDPRAGGVARVAKAHRSAVEHDPARVRRVHPGDHLDEGRLARAVLAQKRVHLAAS